MVVALVEVVVGMFYEHNIEIDTTRRYMANS